LAVDAHGMPVRMLVTAGTTADCTQACKLVEGIDAGSLIADKGYDSNAIVEQAKASGMQAVIPPKKNRKEQREYDKDLYRLRHLVENAFLHLKAWRGIATRYAKNTASFLAAVHIRCIVIWARIYWRRALERFRFKWPHRKALCCAQTLSPALSRKRERELGSVARKCVRLNKNSLVQSRWDGSYPPVKECLQRLANDPDSIKIDGCTKVYHTKNGWLVGCDYRGRNAFGGMIRQSNWFPIVHGRVTKMHEASAYKP
jgi:transposase